MQDGEGSIDRIILVPTTMMQMQTLIDTFSSVSHRLLYPIVCVGPTQ